MKTSCFLLLRMIATGLLTIAQAQSVTDITVAVSPFYDAADNELVRRKLTRFILEAPPGTHVVCDDGYNLETIASFEVPKLRFDSPANRARTLARPLGALAVWFATTNRPFPSPELKDSAALKAPDWLRQVASRGAEHPRAFLLLGSPLYVSTTEPAFSMAPDLYPGDGHLVASLEQSIYGLGDDTNRLAGVTLHWVFPNQQVFANDLHAYHLRRVWSIYVSLRGGSLASFSADLAGSLSCLNKSGLPPVGRFPIEAADTKLEMRVARPREIPRWMPQPVARTNTTATPPNGPAAQAPRSAAAPNVAITLPWQAEAGVVRRNRTARPVVFAVGLMWEARADVDLYVTPPGYPELWFGNVLGPSGRYLHDFRDRNAGHDYEWVEVWESVDPKQVTAWVNLFEGAGPARGTVCVYYQGKKYLSTFELRAPHGNHGADRTSRDTNPYWVKLDIPSIVAQTPVP